MSRSKKKKDSVLWEKYHKAEPVYRLTAYQGKGFMNHCNDQPPVFIHATLYIREYIKQCDYLHP